MTEVSQDEDGIQVKFEEPLDALRGSKSMIDLGAHISAGLQDGLNYPTAPQNDPVNHPSHYTHYQGLEIIDLVEQMNFCKGNAVKYIARAGLKNPDTEVEDLEKAVWYLKREIDRIQNRP